MTTETSMELSDRQMKAITARDAITGARPVALVPHTFLEAQAFCGALAASDLIPQKLKDRAPDVLVIVLAGIEIGLAPMQSLRLHHVINGVPRLSADGIAAIVAASPLCEYLEYQESTETRSTWRTKKRGRPEQTLTWTIERARMAGLLDGPQSKTRWAQYPADMLNARCKAALCRLVYPEVAAGMISREEAYDGVIDAEFREAPATFVAPLAPVAPPAKPPVRDANEQIEVIASGDPTKRGPGRPPGAKNKDKPIDVAATEPATKLDAAIAKVEQKAEPKAPAAAVEPPATNPEPAREVEPAPSAPASASDGFGDEDPPDTAAPAKSIDGFIAWLASCKNQAALQAGKEEWIAWSKTTYEQNSEGAKAMRVAFGKRNSEVSA